MSEVSYRNYLQDESVLIQLILNEYLNTCKAFKATLRLLRKELKNDQWTPRQLDRIIEDIRPSVIALAGTARRVLFPIPWKNQLGYLEKLEDYCYLLVLHSEGSNPTYFTLHREIQEARVMAKQMMRIIQLWECQSSFFLETFETKHVHTTLEELCERIRNIADALSIALQFSVNPENVILYFLRNHHALSTYLGKRFMKNTLNNMFPQGTKNIRQNIKQNLAAKGLERLENEIPALFDKVKC